MLTLFLRRVIAVSLSVLAMSMVLSACHVTGHVPPGQAKKFVAPPPGHGGIPPGQAKLK